jgi:hypothetical protein
MHKKLTIACMAIAAFAAFVIPPAASGAVLTESGVAVAVGSSIKGENVGSVTFTGAFNLGCSKEVLTGATVVNSGGTTSITVPSGGVHLSGTGAGGDCTSALGDAAVTVSSEYCTHISKGTDAETVNGCTGNLVVTFAVTPLGSCKYSTASISGSVVTNTTPVTGNFSEQELKKSEGGIFCPSSGKLDMSIRSSTTDGTGLTIS